MKLLSKAFFLFGALLFLVAVLGPDTLRYIHQRTGAELFGWFMNLAAIRVWLLLLSVFIVMIGAAFRAKYAKR
jgi:multisubunit Na+/H+ antiporter MnhG subunit